MLGEKVSAPEESDDGKQPRRVNLKLQELESCWSELQMNCDKLSEAYMIDFKIIQFVRG